MANDNAQAQELAVMPPAKAQDERVERVITEEEHRGISKGDHALMRSKVDDLSVWESLRRFKLVAGIAMIAAFSASLDGYRECPPSYPMLSSDTRKNGLIIEPRCRNQSQRWHRGQQGIHPADGQSWHYDY